MPRLWLRKLEQNKVQERTSIKDEKMEGEAMTEQKYPDYWSKEKRREYNKRYREEHIQHIKQLQKQWFETHREQQSETQKRWRKNHPQRRYTHIHRKRTPEVGRAHNFVQRHAELLASICELCYSTEMLCGHHPDYSEPHIIVTLCPSCHKWVHKGD